MLYLFTSSYPYGVDGTFLETEIPYLAEAFEKIQIVPLANFACNKASSLPSNVSVTDTLIKKRARYLFPYFFNRRVLRLYIKEFFSSKVYISVARVKNWIISLIQTSCILKSDVIKEIENKIGKNDILYFYWGNDTYILAYLWKGQATFVSRFHGSCDLWEEYTGGYKPFRDKIMNSLKYAFPISLKGQIYLKNKYPTANIQTSRLGTKDYGVCSRSQDDIYRIVSCSSVIPLKRVNLIFETLNSIKDISIEWTHIGDGCEMPDLRNKINLLSNKNLKVNLLGNISHEQVMSYYKSHCVDLFVNLSTIEGIPVSIMEAISFNIPVIATDVGATSEIVTEKTGLLIDSNSSISEISSAIHAIRKMNFEPRSFWFSNYNAEQNYKLFISTIKNDNMSCDKRS